MEGNGLEIETTVKVDRGDDVSSRMLTSADLGKDNKGAILTARWARYHSLQRQESHQGFAVQFVLEADPASHLRMSHH
jgi:hypothetical protein